MSSAGAKRSLFNRPAWASRAPASSDTKATEKSNDIFGQTRVYDDIVAAERKRREAHAAKVKQREEKAEVVEVAKIGDTKRRRISKNEDDDDDKEEDESKENDSDIVSVESDSQRKGDKSPSKHKRSSKRTPQKQKDMKQDSPSTSPSPRRRGRKRSEFTMSDPPVIEVEDDDDKEDGPVIRADEDLYKSPTRKHPQQQQSKDEVEIIDSDEDDEYLQELKRKAREEAQQKRHRSASKPNETQEMATTTATTGDTKSPSVDIRVSPHTPPANTRATSTSTSDAANDVEVLILIDSIMQGTKPLVVKRLASQPLKTVKDYWCKKHELHPVIASKVFLTWNGTKLYDSTTMRGILERLKKTHPLKDGGDPGKGRIQLEAMTEEIWEHRQQQKERLRNGAAGVVENNDGANEGGQAGMNESASHEPEQQPAEPAPKPGTIIKLVCPGIEDFPLRVRPNTTIQKMIVAYRRMREIDDGKQVWLSYDGDRLEPSQTAEQAGFEEDDAIDVHLR